MPTPDDELYYALVNRGSNTHHWRAVDKSFFARTDQPTACASEVETLKRLIADHEGVPPNAIREEWGGGRGRNSYEVGGDTVEALPALMEYTKRENRPVPYVGIINAFLVGRQLKLPTVNVNKNRRKYHWGLIIDQKWVIEEHWITYTPTHAAALIADEPTKMAFQEGRKKGPRSKIPCFQVLWPMVSELRDRINDVYPFNKRYEKRRYYQTVAHIRTPNTLAEQVTAIPALLKLYWLLKGDLNYRTKAWKESVKVLIQKHSQDVAMTKELWTLVTREYAHRQPWEVEDEEKGKRKKKSADAP